MGQFLSQPSFSAGEITPSLYGRVDQDLYYIGLRTCRNFIIKREGGAMNRPGSYFTAEAINSANPQRVIPFQFNDQQTYVIELNDLTMRLVSNNGEITETAATFNISSITQATQGVVTATGHTLTNGQDVYLSGIKGMTQLNTRSVRVSDIATNTFKLKDYQGNYIDTSLYGAYTSGGTAARIYTVTTPWAAVDLFSLNFAQSADVLTIVHQKYPVYDVTRTANDAWTIAPFNVKDGPFKDINSTTTTVSTNATAVNASVTLAASAAIFNASDVGSLFYIEQNSTDSTGTWEVGKSISSGTINRADYNYYKALNSATTGTVKPTHLDGSATDGDSGVQWQYLHSGFGIVNITGFTDSTHVTGTIIKYLPDNLLTIPSADWSKAAWSNAEGYPGAVSYYKGRFWFGGTINAPNNVWSSNTDLRTEFGVSKPIVDDDSITIKLDTTKVNAVRHLVPLKALIAYTSSSSQSINGANGNILATSPPPATNEEGYGSTKVRPLIVGNVVLSVSTANVVRTTGYEFSSDSYTGTDQTIRSSHLFRKRTVVDWDYQEIPEGIVWTTMSGTNKYDGNTLLAFTFLMEQKVMAWSRMDTLGTYESVCCIREGDETAAYKMVSRTVNGTTRRYLERDASREFDTIVDAMFVDCGLTYDGRNTTTTSVTVTGGTTWDNPEVLNIAASAPIFNATDIGNQIQFWTDADPDNNIMAHTYGLIINAYTDSQHVTAVPTKALPVAYQGSARTDWNFARKVFGPFNHLIGQNVACLSDGNVVEGISIPTTGVKAGLATIPDAGVVVHIGLPYTAELETLDMAQPQGQSKSKTVNIPRLFISVEESRAIFVATNNYGNTSRNTTTDIYNKLRKDKFVEVKSMLRTPQMGYDAAIPALTGVFEVITNSGWSKTGRICIRAPYPLPISVNCITEDVPVGYS